MSENNAQGIWKTLRGQYYRVKLLITGHAVWIDTKTKEEHPEHLDWYTRWAISGVHSHNWRWVHRFGKLPCGCTRNPLTRRMVLIRYRCSEHCSFRVENSKT
jgi:hypothetical protein